jgi:heat shock protein beta
VTKEEYEAFYSTLDKFSSAPLNWTHFRAEGDVEFTALLYVPSSPPPGSTDFTNAESFVRLYVKRVFISDSFDKFLPEYLNFIRVENLFLDYVLPPKFLPPFFRLSVSLSPALFRHS